MCWTTCRHLCTSVVAMSQIGGIVSKYMLQESGRSISRWIGKTGKRVCCGEVVTEVHMTLQRQLYNVVYVGNNSLSFLQHFGPGSITHNNCLWALTLEQKFVCHRVMSCWSWTWQDPTLPWWSVLTAASSAVIKWVKTLGAIICMLNNALAEHNFTLPCSSAKEQPCNVRVVYVRTQATQLTTRTWKTTWAHAARCAVTWAVTVICNKQCFAPQTSPVYASLAMQSVKWHLVSIRSNSATRYAS